MTLRLSAVLFSTLILGACATWIDTPLQEVTLKTPGTDQARCLLDNKVNVYQIYSDQTIKMQRNDEDIKITCTAPGNKNVSTVIERDLNAWTLVNITNGIVPGVSYDHFSGALYDYPKTITVDFSTVTTPGFPPPEYNRAGTQDPSRQVGEEWEASAMKSYIPGSTPRKMNMGEIRSRSNPLGNAGDGSAGAASSGSPVEIYNP